MSCLISFVWDSPSCEEREASKNAKMKIYVSIVNKRPLAYQSGACDRSATPTGYVLNSNTILAFNKTNKHDVQSMYQIDYGLVCSWKVLWTVIDSI